MKLLELVKTRYTLQNKGKENNIKENDSMDKGKENNISMDKGKDNNNKSNENINKTDFYKRILINK